MGVEIDMSAGWGVHIPPEKMAAWAYALDPEEDKVSLLEEFLKSYPSLGYTDVSNAWVGEEKGVVLWARSTVETYYMDQGAEAGVYSASNICKPSSTEALELADATREIAGSALPPEFLVAVSVF